MNYLLDTDTVSYIIKKNSPFREPLLHKITAHKPSQIYISELTQCELYYGLEHIAHDQAQYKETLSHAIHALLGTLNILSLGKEAPSIYGKIRAGLISHGQDIGVMDSLIASQAIAHGMTLVTHNLKHFKRIQALPQMEMFKIVDWI